MKHWTPDEHDEYDAACHDAWRLGERSSSDRTDAFVRIVSDAEQADRGWARDVREDAERIGLAAKLKSWKKRINTVLLPYNDVILIKPGVVGVKRQDAKGVNYDQQVLLHEMTREQVATKRSEYLTSLTAYSSSIALMDKLQALLDRCPEAVTTGDAARMLGTTVEAWLSDAAA